MSRKSPQVDQYIDNAPDYAKPILKRLRALFHRACPQVGESMKWSHPAFDYKGVLASMAAFKRYVRWGFWKSSLIRDPKGWLKSRENTSDLSELPPDAVLLDFIRQAMALNESGTRMARPKPARRPPPKLPADLRAALRGNPRAAGAYEAFSPSHKREYVEWITSARKPETRQRRVAQTVAQIEAGKSLHWKYQ